MPFSYISKRKLGSVLFQPIECCKYLETNIYISFLGKEMFNIFCLIFLLIVRINKKMSSHYIISLISLFCILQYVFKYTRLEFFLWTFMKYLEKNIVAFFGLISYIMKVKVFFLKKKSEDFYTLN